MVANNLQFWRKSVFFDSRLQLEKSHEHVLCVFCVDDGNFVFKIFIGYFISIFFVLNFILLLLLCDFYN